MRIAMAENILGQEINIGNNQAIRIGELAEKIFALVGKNPTRRAYEITSESQRLRPAKSEVMKLHASNQKAKELMGWSPQVSLDEGLTQTIAWIKDHLELFKPDIYTV